MTSSYAVTFCNAGGAKLALIGKNGIERVVEFDRDILESPADGLTGIVLHNAQLFVGLQSYPHACVVFSVDRDFNIVAKFRLDAVKDIHGLYAYNGDLLIVSTGSNQIFSFNPDSGTMRPFWSAAECSGDTLHLNDIVVRDNKVYCSWFGCRAPNAMRNGEIVEITSGARICRNLREPHSVAATDDAVFVLESPAGDLLCLREGHPPRRVLGIAGYARGLSIDDMHFVIGKSGYRSESRHGVGDARLAPLTQSDAARESLAASGVFIVDRATSVATFIDTTAIGPEIYQIIGLPDGFGTDRGPPEASL